MSYQILTPAGDNSKLSKSLGQGFLSWGISLAPHTTSGINVCSHATEGPNGCVEPCLFTAGNGRFARTRDSRILRTQFLFGNPELFFVELERELKSAADATKRAGLLGDFRANIISDLDWRSDKRLRGADGQSLFDLLAKYWSNDGWTIHDYTKVPGRYRREMVHRGFEMPWHLTFSWSGSNLADCLEVLRSGGTVAVPFDLGGRVQTQRKLPKYWNGYPVIDGDLHDLRFLDPCGRVVGLRAKHRARGKAGAQNFVQPGEGEWERLQSGLFV